MPASVQALTGGGTLAPGLATAAGHAHELLFGYALAVVIGFLATGLRGAWLWLLLALWIAARAANLLAPGHFMAMATDLAVAGLLAAEVAPRLLGSVRKWRNLALPGVLLGLVAAVAAFHLTTGEARGIAILEAVLLYSPLLGFMGGRVIAPAVGGEAERRGIEQDARVQPTLEGLQILSLVAALGLLPVLGPGAGAGLAVAASGALATARLLRWRPWRMRGRPDLAALAAGYGWVGVGLVLVGTAWMTSATATATVHAVLVGGLGTLTVTVMARTRLVRAGQNPARAREIPAAALLMSLAAALRLAAETAPEAVLALLWGASLGWSLALLLLLRLLFTVPAR